MPEYIITDEAAEDINEILAYIALDNFNAALAFYNRLTDLFEMLAQNSKAGRERSELKEGIRSFPEGNYLVFYRQWAGQIALARVIHAARDLDEIFN